jgi:hypothetical protein
MGKQAANTLKTDLRARRRGSYELQPCPSGLRGLGSLFISARSFLLNSAITTVGVAALALLHIKLSGCYRQKQQILYMRA